MESKGVYTISCTPKFAETSNWYSGPDRTWEKQRTWWLMADGYWLKLDPGVYSDFDSELFSWLIPHSKQTSKYGMAHSPHIQPFSHRLALRPDGTTSLQRMGCSPVYARCAGRKNAEKWGNGGTQCEAPEM